MPDIISQGGDRETSRWPRRLAAVAVAAALLAAVIAVHLPRHRPGAARHAPAASTAAPRPPVPRAGSVTAVAGEPDGVIGQAPLRDGTLRLPVTGQQPAWLWPATGRSERIGGLPLAGPGYQFTRVSGGWAIQPDPAARPGCGSCAGVARPVYFLADRAEAARMIATADQVAPAATAGALWLTSYLPGTDMSTAAGTAREVSVTGAPLRPPFRLPAGYAIDQATSHGLLLAPVIQRTATTAYQLWDPAAAHLSRTFGAVIAAGPARIAWTARCAPLCRVHVLDLASGRDTVVVLPAGSSAANGAFSPDGALLALQLSVSSGDSGDGGALAMQLDVASAATGRLTVVPGTWVSSDAMAGFGWPAGSDNLVAELSFTTKVQVASWRPGAARLAVAVIGPAQNPGALVVG